MSSGIPYSAALASYAVLEKRPLPELDIATKKLLQNFHPDYRPDTTIPLTVGPNKGDQCHRQLAAVLQSDARIDEADLAGAPIIETDILVIGSGGAGCAAAMEAARAGARVLLTTKLRLGDSNTVMAEGGIQASIMKSDTPQMHYDDTIKAGHHYAEKELVAEMVMDGPETIRWLIKQGMQFDLTKYGDLLTRRAGGTSANRVCYYRDYTGLEMMRVLREAVSNLEVEIWDYSPVVELLVDEVGRCAGAVISDLRKRRYVQVKARSVIMATGGIGRMHLNGFPTSNHFGATADGLVLAYRLGAKLRDLDSFQYHPTGLAFPQHLVGTLITEGVRSSGTWLLNGKGERFIDELLPRDIVAAAILRECAEGRCIRVDDESIGVWLDTPGLERRKPGTLQKRFPKLLHLGERCGIDPATTPLLIYPTLHYQNGGVKINSNGLTSVPGLYCVGEVSGGIHGKNRLMGNALLEIISYGRRAGRHAAEYQKGRDHKRVSIEHLSRLRRELTLSGMNMDTKGPMLFPDCAKFDDDIDYDGFRKKKK
jgi:L-aspartate oxidase